LTSQIYILNLYLAIADVNRLSPKSGPAPFSGFPETPCMMNQKKSNLVSGGESTGRAYQENHRFSSSADLYRTATPQNTVSFRINYGFHPIYFTEDNQENDIMTAYELYYCDGTSKYHFVGVLRERRRNPIRITRESVMKWGKMILSEKADIKDLYFIQVEF
jgi:hypothetical protein